MKKLNLMGETFEFLTVVGAAPNSQAGKTRWECECRCGAHKIIPTSDLRQGKVISCGCYNAEQRKTKKKHGMTHTRLYATWANMVQRCSNPNVRDYESYGGRGILVCDEWHDFKAFSKWALSSGYTDKLTIERVNNDKGYSPDNCKWATQKEQNRNTRRTVNVTYEGKTHCLKDWAAILGVNCQSLHSALRRGESFEEYARRKL